MISVVNLSKYFGTQVLFENATFNIEPNDKLGLVGRNGAGKTTLFKILLNEEQYDSGTITIPKNYKIASLAQIIKFSKKTLIEEICSNFLNDNLKWKAEKIIFGLGFNKDDLQKNPYEFSGGFQIRINLAKALLSEPNLLLLDEPGNYLDIVSIRWLIKFLKEWKNELILITHDRNFMDQIVNGIIGIHRNKIKKINGNTEKFYNQIIKEEEIYEKTRINDEKKRKEIEIFINRFRSKASLASRVQSKIKMLEKNKKNEKLEKIEDLDFEFSYYPFEAKVLMEIDNLSFKYENSNYEIIKNLSFNICKNDRIAVIGKNGKGKTTLLKLLSGKLKAVSGNIKKHNETKIGYFEQTNIEILDDNKTIQDEIAGSLINQNITYIRNICGAMMFGDDLALKKIGVLSGGEKTRVILAKVIANPSNLLLLDEPTNHLDMQSCDSFLEALDYYPGAIVMATHNEMFLNALAEKLIVFDDDKIFIFNGNYQEFLEKHGWKDEEDISKTYNEKDDSKEKNLRKIIRIKRASIIEQKSKELKPIEQQIKTIENKIIELENQNILFNKIFEEATINNNKENIIEYSQKILKIKDEIDKLYESLFEITEKYEDRLKYYNEILENI